MTMRKALSCTEKLHLWSAWEESLKIRSIEIAKRSCWHWQILCPRCLNSRQWITKMAKSWSNYESVSSYSRVAWNTNQTTCSTCIASLLRESRPSRLTRTARYRCADLQMHPPTKRPRFKRSHRSWAKESLWVTTWQDSMSSLRGLTVMQPRNKTKRTDASMKRCNSECKKLPHQRPANFPSRSSSMHKKNTTTWQQLGVCHHWWYRTKMMMTATSIMAMTMSCESL